MIAPSRRRPTISGEEQAVQGEKAIACGGFDGFSGFINKEFRVHDYFLGRFNCEIMLRNYFIIPESALSANSIFRDGYQGIDRSKFCVIQNEKKYYPIIPIFEERREEFPIPIFSSGSNWPFIGDKEVEQFHPQLKKRAEAILLNIVKVNRFYKFLLYIGARVMLNRMLGNTAMNTIKKALKDHELLKS